jgi:hypothetical protein
VDSNPAFLRGVHQLHKHGRRAFGDARSVGHMNAVVCRAHAYSAEQRAFRAYLRWFQFGISESKGTQERTSANPVGLSGREPVRDYRMGGVSCSRLKSGY